MVELADTLDLGSSGKPCRFESCCPHHVGDPSARLKNGKRWMRLPFFRLCSGSPPFPHATRCAGLVRGPILKDAVRKPVQNKTNPNPRQSARHSALSGFSCIRIHNMEAQRQYDLRCEIADYLKTHPKAAVVNLGCGLDDSFSKADNGQCKGYNLNLSDVIPSPRATSSARPGSGKTCGIRKPSAFSEPLLAF